MDPQLRGDDHHDGTSDATPGGYAEERRPGELVFAAIMFFGSLFLLYEAYGISGFEALSSPGSVPMATTAAMSVAALSVLISTARRPKVAGETIAKDILPWKAVLFFVLLVVFGMLLTPLGFLPTSALFLIIAIKVLAKRGWGFTLAVSLGSLALIWMVFRIVFAVLMPAGIVPEAEFIQIFRDLFAGGAA